MHTKLQKFKNHTKQAITTLAFMMLVVTSPRAALLSARIMPYTGIDFTTQGDFLDSNTFSNSYFASDNVSFFRDSLFDRMNFVAGLRFHDSLAAQISGNIVGGRIQGTTLDTDISRYNIDVLYFLNSVGILGNNIEPYMIFGYGTYNFNGALITEKSNLNSARIGVGIQFSVFNKLALRASIEYNHMLGSIPEIEGYGGIDSDFITKIGFIYYWF